MDIGTGLILMGILGFLLILIIQIPITTSIDKLKEELREINVLLNQTINKHDNKILSIL